MLIRVYHHQKDLENDYQKLIEAIKENNFKQLGEITGKTFSLLFDLYL